MIVHRSSLAALFASTIAIAALAASSFESHASTRPKDLESELVEITFGGVFAKVGEPQQRLVMLTLRNKTEQPLWVRVTVTSPASTAPCVIGKQCPPGEDVSFECEQATILPKTDYPVEVAVFADSLASDPIEISPTTMRFSKDDLKTLDRWLEARALPRTYDNVLMKDKLGVAAAFMHPFGGGGTLTVKLDGLEWSTKKETVSVPLSRMIDVDHRQLPNSDTWIVLRYQDESGAQKELAFMGSMLRNSPSALELQASLQALIERKAK